eukprot:3155919-Alexandrium_andersonii.AAC.1
MTKPELAGDGLGLELWRLLAREHEAPQQPVAQREFPKAPGLPKALPGRGGAPDSLSGMGGSGPGAGG